MSIIQIFFLSLFVLPFLLYFYKNLTFLDSIKQLRKKIHSFEAFNRLEKGDYEVVDLEYPLIFASTVTVFFTFLLFSVFIFFVIAAIFGLRLDSNMDVPSNIIFNLILAACFLLFNIYILRKSTLIILDDKGIKADNHFAYLISFARLKEYAYDQIDGIKMNLIIGKKRKGTQSIGTKLTVKSKDGNIKLRPNILYNNETLLLIAGLKEKLGDKLEIIRK